MLALLLLAACGVDRAGGTATGPAPPTTAPTTTGVGRHFDVVPVATGFDRPTFVGAAPGDPSGLWVVEQPGRVVRIDGQRRDVALDWTGRVKLHTEAGLLGLAFHPGFATNRRAFLHWSDPTGATRVAEVRAGVEGTSFQPEVVRDLLHLEQPEENHNGGQLAFGPDGRLYLGLGDGGGAFDPRRSAQDPGQLLGKLVAVDVDAVEPVWDVVLSGLRNPWRFSFDPGLSELWVADVGQDQVEEINRVRLELDEPPKNLGWSAYDGTTRVEGRDLDPTGELIMPVATYDHGQGCAVIGGFVYYGTQLPELNRRYLYGDFCSGTLWSLVGTPVGGAADVRRETATVPQLTHIGTDATGEIVFTSATGTVYQAVP